MKTWGWLLLAGGIAACTVAMFLETSVSASTASVDGVFASQQVFNLGLLQRQMMMFNGGCALAMSGIVLLVGGVLQGRLRSADGSSVADFIGASSLDDEPASQSDARENALDRARADRLVAIIVVAIIAIATAAMLIVYVAK